MTQTFGYIRVSTLDQNSTRQLDGEILDRVFTDKASGKDQHRPKLAKLIDFSRDGGTVLVRSMDRLARNLDDLRAIVRQLTDKKVQVRFVKEDLTSTAFDTRWRRFCSPLWEHSPSSNERSFVNDSARVLLWPR